MTVSFTIPTVGGTLVSSTNPIPVIDKGSTGTNASAAQPANVSALTGAGLVLLGTLAANASRGGLLVQNQSGADVVVVGDPGVSDTAIWTFILTGVSTGTQGAELPPGLGAFRGRIRVYGATGARVCIVEF